LEKWRIVLMFNWGVREVSTVILNNLHFANHGFCDHKVAMSSLLDPRLWKQSASRKDEVDIKVRETFIPHFALTPYLYLK
jgi:hypothetical protein